MNKTVVYLFPGQRPQKVGLGKKLCDQSSVAKETFRLANQILGFDFQAICFEGPENLLNHLSCIQMAIFVTSIADWRIRQESSFDSESQVVAGRDIGEISALVAAGALDFEIALRFLQFRSELMLELNQENPTRMILNFGNSYILSPLLEKTSKRYSKYLDKMPINSPALTFYSSITGRKVVDQNAIRHLLDIQIVQSDCLENMIQCLLKGGINKFIEIEPGHALSSIPELSFPNTFQEA